MSHPSKSCNVASGNPTTTKHPVNLKSISIQADNLSKKMEFDQTMVLKPATSSEFKVSFQESHDYQLRPQQQTSSNLSEENKNPHSLQTTDSYTTGVLLPCSGSNTSPITQQCVLNSMARVYRRQRQIVIPFIWGILVGITITAVLFQQHILFRNAIPWPSDVAKTLVEKEISNNSNFVKMPENTLEPPTLSLRVVHQNLDKVELSSKETVSSLEVEEQLRLKTRIFVGVITAEKFLSSRSVAVNNTWGAQVDKVEFFAGGGSPEEYRVPVVTLDGVSDSEYPPQRKMFTMLKHICQHHLNNFEWFVRADDDVYIRVEKLRKFLSQIDGEKTIYMGQPGHGVPEVREKLGLNGHNFCMGGPGVILNRNAMKELCPHIDHCMEEVVSKEEDVELGRCVTNHLHIECTHAWETLKLFYHSYQEEYTEEKPFLGNLAENDHVSLALTLHHLKVPYIMYRVHRHYTSLLLNSTKQKILKLGDDLDHTNVVLPLEQQKFLVLEKSVAPDHKPQKVSQVIAWKSFEVDSIYSLSPSDVTSDITNDLLADLKQVGETGIDDAIGHPQPQKFTYSHVSDGYIRSDPHRGTDYLLDVYFKSKTGDSPGQVRRVKLLRPTGDLEVTRIREIPSIKTGVPYSLRHFYVILPVLFSHSSLFESFMRNHYEPNLISSRIANHVTLIVVAIDDNDVTSSKQSWTIGPPIDDVMKWYNLKYPNARLITLHEESSNQDSDVIMQHAYARGVMHASTLANNSLAQSNYLIMTSSSVTMNSDVVDSCVIRSGVYVDKGRSPVLYQPVPFRVFPASSLFPPPSNEKDTNQDSTNFKSNVGFWDSYVTTGEVGNALTAPLCGRLNDFASAASDAVAHSNVTRGPLFRQILFDRVYSGKLEITRTPDRNFINIPRR